jgi:hypothetical protein
MDNKLNISAVAIGLTLSIDLLMLLFFNIPFDWYLIPISLCGIFSAYQIIFIFNVTNEYSLRLPLVFYFYCTLWFGCYFAPLLHFALNFWLIFNNSLVLPKRWEPYVFIIGVLNAIGLLLFIYAYKYFYGISKVHNKVYLLLSALKFNYVYWLCGISFVCQVIVYAKLGGISGFISTYETRSEDQGFAGFGLLFIISEFFLSL